MKLTNWLKTSFSKDKIPDWTCPSCSSGFLKIDTSKFYFEETKLSLSWHDNPVWDPEFIQYRFCGTLTCKNCNDQISFIGDGEIDHVHYYDDFQDGYVEKYNEIFTPKYFNPPLNIFQINEKCPNEIKDEIVDSFRLFWSDLPSCANKIRTGLEMLMTQQKVKKTNLQRGRRKKLMLHKRIEEFKLIKPEIADFLLAIKWIGNSGSHVGKLERIDVLDAYELLEHSLNKLFNGRELELIKKTKEINKRKGTRKKLPTKIK